MSGSDNNYYGMGFDQVGLLRQFALSFRSSVYQNSLPVENELIARGYDITTLDFSIKKLKK